MPSILGQLTHMDQAELKYIIFHIDEGLDKIHEIKQIFDSYSECEKYFIAFESDPRDHYHLLSYCSEKTYNSLIDRLKKTYDLVNRQKKLRKLKNPTQIKGGHCLYTRPRGPVKDWSRFLMYIQKEHKPLTTLNDEIPEIRSYSKGFDPELLEKLKEQSFKKDTPKKNLEIIIQHLEDTGPFGVPEFDQISTNFANTLDYPDNAPTRPKHNISHTQTCTLQEIYKFINENPNISLSLSKTAINNYYLNYLRKTKHYSMENKIHFQMYFNNHF